MLHYVSTQELLDFINAQPDDREIVMDQNKSDASCGCVMVHYGRAQGWKFRGCGTHTWEGEDRRPMAVMGGSIFRFAPIFGSLTYGELKRRIAAN